MEWGSCHNSKYIPPSLHFYIEMLMRFEEFFFFFEFDRFLQKKSDFALLKPEFHVRFADLRNIHAAGRIEYLLLT